LWYSMPAPVPPVPASATAPATTMATEPAATAPGQVR
jgi:hypothetical protein